jgi:hypothetical protein
VPSAEQVDNRRRGRAEDRIPQSRISTSSSEVTDGTGVMRELPNYRAGALWDLR